MVVGSNPAIRHNQNNHWPQPWPVLCTKCSAHMAVFTQSRTGESLREWVEETITTQVDAH